MQNKREFVVVQKERETDGVFSLFLKPTDNSKYDYISGQYVGVKPPGIVGHGKCYTISSTPNDELVRLTVKRQGQVSSAITDMTSDEKILLEGPYGNFYPDEKMNEVIMIAGGIGITPFFSVVKSNLEKRSEKKFTLFYSNKTKNDIIFFDDLNELATANPNNLEIIYCLTQEKNADEVISENKRINKEMIKKYVSSLDHKCYYVCGSIGFVNDMWKLLKELGVLEENIFTESFY